MKEYYPYTVVPFSVEKIRSEGIPAPRLPKLMLLPAPVRRRYFGTVIFILSFTAFIVFAAFVKWNVYVPYITFFIALISLVATIFEFVQHSQLEKQYKRDYELYLEHKEIYKKLKSEQEKVNTQNKDEKQVKEYQKEKVKEFFKTSYDIIIAVHNEYSPAKKRFKLFLEEYFPDEILENVKVVHEAKKLEYVPDFVIKFDKPKLNVAIEIEEPYTLSNVPENIQKDYEAKDRIRQRFANELGWIVIVLSEEQAVASPTECCKFVEESIELLYGDIKSGDKFVNIKTIKKQKMLTGDERANLKNSKYREKYLTEAGLLDNQSTSSEEFTKIVPEISEDLVDLKVETNNRNGKIQEEAVELINNSDTSKLKEVDNILKTTDKKKSEIENEQMLLIKKMALKLKVLPEGDDNKVIEQEPIIYKTDDSLEIKEKELEEEPVVMVEDIEEPENIEPKVELTQKGEQLRKEEDILKDLYNALDKHSKKQKERKEKRVREKVIGNVEHSHENEMTEEIKQVKVIEKELVNTVEIKEEPVLLTEQKDEVQVLSEIIHDSKSEEIIEKDLVSIDELKKEPILINDQKLEDQVTSVILEETKVVNLDEQKKLEEPISNEAKVETIEEPKILTEIVEPEKEDVTATEKNEALLENKRILIEQNLKNQELIDAYREKIEGAVFDKLWDELIDLCNKAIKEIPTWDWAYYRRSTAWGNKKDFVKVLEDCNKAIGFNPTLADAYYNRGTARFFLGKYKDASEDYQKSIDLNYVKMADAHFNRGLCFQKLDHKKAAYLEFVKAKELGSLKAIDFIKKEYQGEE